MAVAARVVRRKAGRKEAGAEKVGPAVVARTAVGAAAIAARRSAGPAALSGEPGGQLGLVAGRFVVAAETYLDRCAAAAAER